VTVAGSRSCAASSRPPEAAALPVRGHDKPEHLPGIALHEDANARDQPAGFAHPQAKQPG
jgi:hypothetical protein